MYCIDASVIISAQLPHERHHTKSRDFLEQLAVKEMRIFLPEILIPEITSGLFRVTGKINFVSEYTASLRAIPNFSFVPIDSHLSNLASWIILKTGLKGADSLYTAVAFYFGLTLITLDRIQLRKSNIIVNARTP